MTFLEFLNLIFGILILAYMFFLVIPGKYIFLKWKSRNWPSTTAKIHPIGKGPIGLGWRGMTATASFFEYNFAVEQQEFKGRFLVLAGGEENAGKLQRSLVDQPIDIHFNPKNPMISFVADLYDLKKLRFGGSVGSQNPQYLEQWPSAISSKLI